jgi:hypothetical protein
VESNALLCKIQVGNRSGISHITKVTFHMMELPLPS